MKMIGDLSEDQMAYVTMEAKERGISISQFFSWLIDSYRQKKSK